MTLVAIQPRADWAPRVNAIFKALDDGFVVAESTAINKVMQGKIWANIYKKGLSRPENRQRALPSSSRRPMSLYEAYKQAVVPKSGLKTRGSTKIIAKPKGAARVGKLKGQGFKGQAPNLLSGDIFAVGGNNPRRFWGQGKGRKLQSTETVRIKKKLDLRGIGIGDQPFLRRNAAHWRAIELGSVHILNGKNLVVGFGTRGADARISPFPPKAPTFTQQGLDPDALVLPAGKAVRWRAFGQPAAYINKPIEAKHYLQKISNRIIPIYFSQMELAFDSAGFNK